MADASFGRAGELHTTGPITDAEAYDPLLRSRHRGLWADAFHRLIQNRLAMAAGVFLIALTAVIVAGNYLDVVQRHDTTSFQDNPTFADPGTRHFMGTDNLGRDTWARVMEGSLISLQIGVGAVLIQLVIGMVVGGGAALLGKWGDNIMMRFTDLIFAFPDLLAIILMRSVLRERDWPIVGNERVLIMLAVSFVAWTTIARLVRGQMLSLGERDFVMAARALGASRWRVVMQHMLPNTLGPVIVAATFGIPLAIFAEAVLSFIGFGIQPPTASLGGMVSDGNTYLQVSVWLAVFPAAAIAVLMLCFTFLGDGLRDALDPRTRGSV